MFHTTFSSFWNWFSVIFDFSFHLNYVQSSLVFISVRYNNSALLIYESNKIDQESS